MIDIIIATKDTISDKAKTVGETFLRSREDFCVRFETEGSWAHAVNKGFSRSLNDIIICDDDVCVSKDTFRDLKQYLPHGDIIGFKLMYPDGRIQHAGGGWFNGQLGHYGYQQQDHPSYSIPFYFNHVTFSLVYIKRSVIKQVGEVEENWPGIHIEDVDYNWRAIKAGFKILYVPNIAIHEESATKKEDPNFLDRIEMNVKKLFERHLTVEFIKELNAYPKPYNN